MIVQPHPPNARSTPRAIHANVMALGLSHAESALHALTSGQIDAIIDPSGNTYLLRPAQEHLRRNEARLQALFDGSPDVITVLNESAEVKYQSPAVLAVLGYEAGELVGRSLYDFVHPDDLLELHRAVSEALETRLPNATAEFRHRTRAGPWRPLEATLGSFAQHDDVSVVMICRDATVRHTTQKAADFREAASAQGSLDKDRFLAMLAHELRTPLTPALLGLHELQKDSRFPEAQSALSMIRRNIELQSRLLDELTDYISVGQHKVRLQIEPIDAHEAVGFVLEICQGEIAAARIKVVTYFQATGKLVLADSMKLQQVMWNLLRNAIKFSTPGGSIFITSANESPGSFTLEIADQGIGIEPRFLPFVFDAYHQGDRSRHQRYGGLGLGMYISKGLVESQHGTLTVASDGLGKGAKFQLRLETAPMAADAAAPATDVAPLIRKVVETFPPIRPVEEGA